MERKWRDEIRLEIVIYNAKETTFFHNFIRCQVTIGVSQLLIELLLCINHNNILYGKLNEKCHQIYYIQNPKILLKRKKWLTYFYIIFIL